MIEIKHVITTELGIHARPAARLLKEVSTFKCAILLGTPAKMVNAAHIMDIMGLILQQGDELTMTFDGSDEAEAAISLACFVKENL